MISAQTRFSPTPDGAKQIWRALPFFLRSNQTIKRALRAAYREFDRTEETRKLLLKHLPE